MNTNLLQIANYHQAEILRFAIKERNLHFVKQNPDRLAQSLKNALHVLFTALR